MSLVDRKGACGDRKRKGSPAVEGQQERYKVLKVGDREVLDLT